MLLNTSRLAQLASGSAAQFQPEQIGKFFSGCAGKSSPDKVENLVNYDEPE